MIKFNVPYEDTNIYPIALKNFFSNLCTQVGLQAGNLSFPNSEYILTGNPFTNNENCRTVLSYIAQLAGGFAKIGRNNNVYITTLGVNSSSVETIDGNNYFVDFNKNNIWGEVNFLEIKVSDIEGEETIEKDNTSILLNGETKITIADNYFLNSQAEREDAIVDLWNSLKGLQYLPFETKYYGYPYLDSGDKINILDVEDNSYTSYVLNHTFIYDGAFSGKITVKAMTKSQSTYQSQSNEKTKFKQVERMINKIDGVIKDVVEEQTDFDYRLTQTTQDVNSIRSQVEEVTDYKREVEGATQIHLEEAGEQTLLKLEIKGNIEYNNYLYPSEDIFPSSDLFPNMEGSELI